jgi:hypothetical protein
MPEEDREQYDWMRTEWTASDNDSVLVIKKRIISRGASIEKARQNATMVDYRIEKTDTLISFARGFDFKPGARFRGQHVELEIYLPKNRPFRIDNRYYWDNEIINHENIELGDMETFILTDDGLKCLSCKPKLMEEDEDEALAPEPDAPNAPATL